ncbi:hypothetical protein [Saccharothrix hoggarensis]|uniref:Uncharacterized protein n=1 Tax=Saccharothrix hoggarensis TaxID=913853 RepID=A0ABW3QHY6_9PSEU
MRPYVVLCAAVLVACSAEPDPGPLFDNEGARDITCLTHQANPPGVRYDDEKLRRTDEVMPLLRYYTAHGRKPFCDAEPATEIDRAWVQLYVSLGAGGANVADLLG